MTGGSDTSPSIHAANCREDGCDWSTLGFSMIEIYGDIEDHLKDDHGYSEDDWRETRKELVEA